MSPVAEGRSSVRLRALLDAIEAGTWIWDLTTNATQYDERWASILGYTLSELEPTTHETWLERVHPDDLPRVRGAGRAYREGKTPIYDASYRMRHRDGRWVWVHDRGRITARAPDGTPLEFCGTHVDITERKEREAQVHLLSVVAQQTTDGVVITDVDGRIRWVNASFTRLTGYASAEVVGRTPGEVLQGPATSAATIHSIAQHLEARRSFTKEILNYRKDGTPFLMRLACDPLIDDNGAFSGFIGIQSDITAHRDAEERLRASEALLEQTGAVAGVGGWEIETATGKGRWTRSLRLIHGVDEAYPTDLDGFIDLFDRAFRDRVRAAIAACAAGNKVDVESRITVSGRKRWVRVVGHPSEDGRHLYGATQDITTQKQAADDLRESHDRFRLVAEGAHDGVWDWDLRDAALYWSPRWKAMLGYEDGDLPNIWDSFEENLHEADRGRILAELARHLTTEEPVWRSTFRMLHKDGSYRWISARGVVLRTSEGRPYRFAGSMLDVTEEQRAAAERSAMQARLVQHEKFESLGRLAAGVAHDFNNMLTVIHGNTKIIRDSEPSGSQSRTALTEVLDAADRAADLARQLMAFARQQPATPRSIDLPATVRRIVSLLQRLMPATVELVLHVDPALPVHVLDAGTLDPILTNLVINARDALPRRIDVHVRVMPDAGTPGPEPDRDGEPGATRPILIEVRDDGIGMPPEVQARIFEPFYTTKELGRGTGLGLANVRAAVRAVSGHIEVESAPGCGARFRVVLPMLPAPPAEPPPAREPPLSFRSLRVVVVDDEPALARLAARMLEAQGAQVRSFTRADLALLYVESHPDAVDVLVTDVVLPHQTGPELAAEVRAINPAIRVIFISGYSDPPCGVSLGAGQGWLAKPFGREDLVNAMAEVLRAEA